MRPNATSIPTPTSPRVQAEAPKAAPQLNLGRISLHLHTWVALAAAGAVTQASLALTGGTGAGRPFKMDVAHVAVGAAMLAVVLLVVYRRQRPMLVAAGVLRGHKKAE